MTTTTLYKLDIRAITNLITEAKRTSCYEVANYATAVLLGQTEKQLSWERKEEKLSEWKDDTWKHDFYRDLVVIKVGKYEVCIPATHLKEEKAKEAYVTSIVNNAVVPKLEHKRKKKLCLPGQCEYLMRKLNMLVPNWREYVKNNLKGE